MRLPLIPIALIAVLVFPPALFAGPKKGTPAKEPAPAGPPPANQPPPPEGRFVDNGDGTITDAWRRLMWSKADSGKELEWQEAWDWCRGLKLGGHADWRMPTGEELHHKLFDGLQPVGKWLGERRVPPFEWSGITYWSASDGDAGHGYPGMNTQDFHEGWGGSNRRDSKAYARACRPLPRPDGPRFKDNGDGTITDAWEGLTWAKADSGQPLTLNKAEEYCRGLGLAGKKGWRMPSYAELHDALYVGLENAKPGLGLDRRIAPFEWSGEAYWSGEAIIRSGQGEEGGAGRDCVRFVDGTHGWVSTENLRFARPVKDGP